MLVINAQELSWVLEKLGRWPVTYKSYQLNDAEKNYPTHKKELLAIVKALKNGDHTSLAPVSRSTQITAPLNISNHKKKCWDARWDGQCTLRTSTTPSHTSAANQIWLPMPYPAAQCSTQHLPHSLCNGLCLTCTYIPCCGHIEHHCQPITPQCNDESQTIVDA